MITIAKAVQKWISAVGARMAYIAPGSPWENGYIESFNARLRDEPLNGEIFYSPKEARIIIESWRQRYNKVRPHALLAHRAPAPEMFVSDLAAWPQSRSSANIRPGSSDGGWSLLQFAAWADTRKAEGTGRYGHEGNLSRSRTTKATRSLMFEKWDT